MKLLNFLNRRLRRKKSLKRENLDSHWLFEPSLTTTCLMFSKNKLTAVPYAPKPSVMNSMC